MYNASNSTYADDIYAFQMNAIHARTDRAFAVLFCFQWVFAVICALWITPYTWIGERSQIHVHVWAAIVLGGLLSLYPIFLACTRPGRFGTRMTVAVAQMLYSSLLIHLTGGRIETHFHVFGSLAFLAFYRDWRVFVPATAVVAADQLARGIFWPESVFGIIVAAPWRAVEHVGWVLFEDVFLIWGTVTSAHELRNTATALAELEDARIAIEDKVDCRTRELQERTNALEAEMKHSRALEVQLLQAQKLESIGQLAAGIAHEINTPMQFVSDNIEYLGDGMAKLFEVVDTYERNLHKQQSPKSWDERWQEVREVMRRNRFDNLRGQMPKAIAESRDGIDRVIHVVRAMKEFSHPGQEGMTPTDLNEAIQSTATISRNRWKYVADLNLDLDPNLPRIECLPAEINQVLLNLVVNAADAIAEKVGENGEKGRITIRSCHHKREVVILVEDNGGGIPDEIRNRIFDPFFTTKDVGKGTGQGLSICYNVVVNMHHGTIDVESTPGMGTQFIVTLPLKSDEVSVVDDGQDALRELATADADAIIW
jgi:signal transduction histidine kinase